MLRLNYLFKLIILSVLLASCQTVQQPVKPEPVTETITIETKPEPKQDTALLAVNFAIEEINNNNLNSAQAILADYLKEDSDPRVELNLALIYIQQEQYKPAKTLLNKLKPNDDYQATVLEQLAIIARHEGQFKHAKLLYEQALNTSEKPSTLLNYAILLDLYLNDLIPALKHYELYQESIPQDQTDIPIDKWIADIKARIERSKK